MRRKLTVLATLAFTLATAATAAAEPAFTKTVHVEPAQLESADGVAALYTQIVDAAREVCAEANFELRDRRLCVRETVEASVAESSIPQLIAFYREGGHAPVTRVAAR